MFEKNTKFPANGKTVTIATFSRFFRILRRRDILPVHFLSFFAHNVLTRTASCAKIEVVFCSKMSVFSKKRPCYFIFNVIVFIIFHSKTARGRSFGGFLIEEFP
jgi:hypothetical protein